MSNRVREALQDVMDLLGDEILSEGTCGYFDVEVKPAAVVAFREARDALNEKQENAFTPPFRFCPRCGKDLKDMPVHTCTPPGDEVQRVEAGG